MMVAAGHKKSYAAGLVAAGGIIAPVIPPSIGFVIFGVAAGVSISKLFLAGIVPGLMLGVGLCFSWWWVVRKENLTPPPRASFAEMASAVIDGFWALMLPVDHRRRAALRHLYADRSRGRGRGLFAVRGDLRLSRAEILAAVRGLRLRRA